MKGKEVYLKSGQLAQLVKKVDEQYLVRPYYYYYGYEGEEYSEPSDTMELVDEIFTKAPTPKFEEELEKLKTSITSAKDELAAIKQEVNTASYELNKLKNEITDVSKYIINRQEIKDAKRITYFSKSGWTANDWTPKSSWDTKISATITIRDGKEEFWVYKLYEDYNSSSDYIDQKYGLLIDKTDEEIEEITKERILFYEKRGELSEHGIKNCDDKYLTPALIEKKNKILQKANEDEKARTEREIKDLAERLERLKNKI